MTASFGVSASRPESGFDYSSVFDDADSALLDAKKRGRRDRVKVPAAKD